MAERTAKGQLEKHIEVSERRWGAAGGPLGSRLMAEEMTGLGRPTDSRVCVCVSVCVSTCLAPHNQLGRERMGRKETKIKRNKTETKAKTKHKFLDVRTLDDGNLRTLSPGFT